MRESQYPFNLIITFDNITIDIPKFLHNRTMAEYLIKILTNGSSA